MVHIAVKTIELSIAPGIVLLVLIICFVLFGVATQYLDENIKLTWSVLGVGGVFEYIFYSDIIQRTDALTHLINRRGYENSIRQLKQKTIILIFDIDKFKNVNDDYGHSFGDICLATVGRAILKTYAGYGKCFRIGGNEFCVILKKELQAVEELNSRFFQALSEEREKEPRLPFVSVGYAEYTPDKEDLEEVIHKADIKMYRYKYRQI